MSLKGTIAKLAIVVGIAVSGYSPRRSGCVLLTHPFLLQVFGVEADAKTCRNTAVSARRVALHLQIIHSYIISAPDELREQLRNMTHMQLIRTPIPKPSASEYRNVTNVYRIALKSLA